MNATKQRFGAKDLGGVFAGAARVRVLKGKQATDFAAGDAALADNALGPTGNLRAPTVRVGKRWLVGFQEDAWAEFFG